MKQALCLCIFMVVAFCGQAQEYTYTYAPFSERDPLRPLVNENGQILIKEKSQFGGFILQGIMYSAGGSTAVINNELYREGDTVEGYTVKKVDEFEVILEKSGEEFSLKWEVDNES